MFDKFLNRSYKRPRGMHKDNLHCEFRLGARVIISCTKKQIAMYSVREMKRMKDYETRVKPDLYFDQVKLHMTRVYRREAQGGTKKAY